MPSHTQPTPDNGQQQPCNPNPPAQKASPQPRLVEREPRRNRLADHALSPLARRRDLGGGGGAHYMHDIQRRPDERGEPQRARRRLGLEGRGARERVALGAGDPGGEDAALALGDGVAVFGVDLW